MDSSVEVNNCHLIGSEFPTEYDFGYGSDGNYGNCNRYCFRNPWKLMLRSNDQGDLESARLV